VEARAHEAGVAAAVRVSWSRSHAVSARAEAAPQHRQSQCQPWPRSAGHRAVKLDVLPPTVSITPPLLSAQRRDTWRPGRSGHWRRHRHWHRHGTGSDTGLARVAMRVILSAPSLG